MNVDQIRAALTHIMKFRKVLTQLDYKAICSQV